METIQISIDSQLKADAETLFAKIGLDLPTAVYEFLAQSVAKHTPAFPYDQNPNAVMRAAYQESQDILDGTVPSKQYPTSKDLFAELDAELALEDQGC